MSNKRVPEARLPGFHGPFFDGLEDLQHLFAGDLQRINELYLSDVRKQFEDPEPIVERLVPTDDGYRWMFGLGFFHYDREFRVLVPCVLDYEVDDGTHSERHVALYYQGDELTPEEYRRITRKVTAAFEDVYDRTYKHIA